MQIRLKNYQFVIKVNVMFVLKRYATFKQLYFAIIIYITLLFIGCVILPMESLYYLLVA